MGFIINLLARQDEATSTPNNLIQQILDIMTNYIFPVLLLVSVVWAIYVGVQLGKAKDEGERKQAKDRFFKALAALIIIGVLEAILIALKAMGLTFK